MLEAIRAGEGRALVLSGEPGIGKTALLDHVADRSAGCEVIRVAGAQAERQLPFAGVHQLCRPLLARLAHLPEPQQEALRIAFGLSAGHPVDRFFVGLAVLGLLAESAEARPLVCLVDDAQWLDTPSASALGFVGRRLSAEPVGLLVATRAEAWPGLERMELGGLDDADARALLRTVTPGRLDERVQERILAETRGNPLALLELPRGLTPTQLAGGFAVPAALGLAGRIEASFRQRLRALAGDARVLLALAAADPTGDPALTRRASERLGVARAAAGPAESDGLIEFGTRVRFRHPLVRSAAYWAVSPADRRRIHGALADVTDPDIDPDRRAWHRAQAAEGPDDAVADDLERSAGRAQARGGLAAGAAFLEHAARLTVGDETRARRCLVAASAKHQAGAPGDALELLALAAAGPLDALGRARLDLLRAQIGPGRAAGEAPTLLEAARRLEPLDLKLARQTYLDALCATVHAGPDVSGCDPREVARRALAAPRPGSPGPVDLLLDGLAARIIDGHAAAAPSLRRALDAFDDDALAVGDGLGWGWLACYIAATLFEHHKQQALARRQVQMAREAGALAVLPMTLAQLVGIHLRNGELAAAAALMEEVEAAAAATGGDVSLQLSLALAVYRGDDADARRLVDAAAGGAGYGRYVTLWGSVLLHNGHGRFADAHRAAHGLRDELEPVLNPVFAQPEIIEAAACCGDVRMAEAALAPLVEIAQAVKTGWALGLEARSRALLSTGDDAERLYREAIRHLTGAGSDVELMRARLLYGEWLRRARRRAEARELLRTAHAWFAARGVQAFAGRAAAELRAAGEHVPTRAADTREALTPQESQIARLARDGLSNPEIGTRLFLSPRTVEWHLRKVFAKLDIASRQQLAHALPAEPAPV